MAITNGEAYADPTHPIHAKLARAGQAMNENAVLIERLVASGLTREQAWHRALFGETPLIGPR